MEDIGKSTARDTEDSKTSRRLLYFCPASLGGIAEYAHAQATALAQQGIDVTMLCRVDWPYAPPTAYRQLRELNSSSSAAAESRWRSRLRTAKGLLVEHAKLASVIRAYSFRRVLLATYLEYLAPFWAPSLRSLMRRGVVFGAILHDPVRDYVVGPLWWHRWSVAEGYSFLREVFIHAETDLGLAPDKMPFRKTVIPHGPYDLGDPIRSRRAVRDGLSLPNDAVVLLSFGHIRDGKNLDILLRAMVGLPDIFLVIAGAEATAGQKTSAFYRSLAEELGVGSRCRWLVRYIETEMVADLFDCVDFVALTYSSQFRSASGVLNLAVRYRRPMIVSSGDSPLSQAIDQYDLGIRVQPDDAKEVARGLSSVLRSNLECDWDGYMHDHSWRTNADRVATNMDLRA
ncbi:glycosyltransferase family 4 protein [Bradyrhizobium sp. 200]|uniref:glycosyltransferase family 4 protein n=1 Tax=Bradyrhizobium sp. 200 TaxID=2782665 RepID=UPI001FFE55EF|nr:glycosyltransferase family 4 protein [Bradyrhizobium sp. 200]UPJ51726.1 glycosyltransferase family 4 protein [Bradyrhizobium sp. 200]